MKLAVFDVCGTLYNSNTTFDFLDWYFVDNKKYQIFRKFSKTTIAKSINYPFYKLLKKDLIRIIGTNFLKNISLSKIEVSSKKFVKEKLNVKKKLDIIEMLKNYKKENYEIILISGSYDFLIKEIANELNIKIFFATKLQNINNNYTGKVSHDQLFNKLKLLTEIYPKYEELVVFSDNLTDCSLLEVACKGYIVCNKRKHLKFWENKNLKNCEVIKHYE